MINDLAATSARHVGLQKCTFCRHCREPLIPEGNGKFGGPRNVSRECACCLAARAFRAVHVERQSQYQPGDLPWRTDRHERRDVLSRFRSADCLDRACHASPRVTRSNTDRCGSEINSDQGTGGGQFCRKGFDIVKNHSASPDLAPASRMIAIAASSSPKTSLASA